jgi:CRISPR system Cascade subunit CasE
MYLSRVMLKPDIIKSTQLSRVLQDRTYGVHRLLWDLFDQQERTFLYREEVAREQIAQPAIKREPIYYVLSAESPKQDSPLFEVQSKPFNPEFYEGQRLSFRLRANPVVTRNKQRHDLVMDEQLVFFRQLCELFGLSAEGRKKDLRNCLLVEAGSQQLKDWLCSYLHSTRYFVEAERGHDLKSLLEIAVQEAIARRLMTWLTDSPSRQGIFSIADRMIEDDFMDETRMVPAFDWQAYNAHAIPEKGAYVPGVNTSRNNTPRFLSVDMSGELVISDPIRFAELLRQGIGAAKGFGCGLMLVKPALY